MATRFVRTEIKQCDRCKRVDPMVHVATTRAVRAGCEAVDIDLCVSCWDGLTAYIEGRKLARVRKAKP